MIYYDDNKYHFCKYKITYTQRGEQITKYVGAETIDWWQAFESEWEDMTIDAVVEVVPTEEQKARFKEIEDNAIMGGFASEVGEYVEKGVFPDKDPAKVLTELKLMKENEEMKKELMQAQEAMADLMLLVGSMGGEM